MSSFYITELLLKQHEQYPKMLIQDMVKLLYQNEFGSGHFVHSEDSSLARLRTEYDSLIQSDEHLLFEDIGNNLCRMHLAGLKSQVSLETVNKFFVHTANTVSGSNKGFEEKLDILKQCCRKGQLPYSPLLLELYIRYYKKNGYPPVSHSEEYRKAYNPAYRIVRSVFRDYFQLFSHIDSLLKTPEPILVAIDGNCASGKSTLTALLSEVYDCNVFHMDDFFLPVAKKTKSRLSEAGGNVDYERFKEEIIKGLNSRAEFSYRPFCCNRQQLMEPIVVHPKQLNIIEGSYSLHPTLVDSYGLKVFLSIDSDLQSKRILERNGPELHQLFINEWIPLENHYFGKLNIKAQCDLVFRA